MNIPPELIEKINQSLSGMVVLKEINYKFDTVQVTNSIIKCYCPIHKETIFRSMTVDEENRHFKCGYTMCPGNKGGNLLELYCLSTKATLETAVLHWAKELKLEEEVPDTQNLISELIDKGNKLVLEKDYDSAISTFQQIVHLVPEQLDIQEHLAGLFVTTENIPSAVNQYKTMAKSAISQSKFDQAETYLDQALKLSPESDEISNELIEFYISQKNVSKAVSILENKLKQTENIQKKKTILDKLVTLEPGKLEWLETKGNLESELGLSENAADNFWKILELHKEKGDLPNICLTLEKLIPLEPGNDDLPNQYALCLIESGKKKDGYKKAIELIEKYKSKKDYPSAIKLLNQVKALLPDKLELEDILIDLLITSGQKKDAIVLLERYADQELLRNHGEHAVNIYQKALSLAPDRIDISRQLIKTYIQLNQSEKACELYRTLAEHHANNREIEQAVGLYQELLSIKPGDQEARERLGALFEENTSSRQAVEQYLILIDQETKNKQFAEAEKLCLRILSMDNENIEARLRLIEIYRILEDSMKMVDIQSQLANLYNRQESFDPARKMCVSVLKTIPNHIQSLKLLIQMENRPVRRATLIKRLAAVYDKQENYDLAANQYRRVIQLVPENLHSLNRLAEILTRLKAPAPEIKKIYFQVADILTKKQKYQDVQDIYNRIHSTDPNDIDVLQKSLSLARTLFEKYPKQYGKDQLTLQMLELAKVLDAQDEHHDSLALYEEILEITPDNMEIKSYLAEIYLKLKRKEDALRLYQSLALQQNKKGLLKELTQTYLTILELDSQNIDIIERLGECYIAQNEIPAAKEQFILLARLSQEKNDMDAAITNYTRLLEIDPENREFSIQLAHCYSAKKNNKKALAILQSVAEGLEKKSEFDELIIVYSEVLQIDPHHLPTHEHLAKLFLTMGRNQEALMEYDIIASIHRQQGKLELALKTYLTALNIDPNNLQIRIVIADTHDQMGLQSEAAAQYYSIAQVLIQSNQWEEAIPLLRRLLEIEPHHVKGQTALAEVYFETDRKAEAAPLLLSLAQQSEKSKKLPEALDSWGKLYALDNKNETALDALIRIHNKNESPQLAIPYYLQLAEVYNEKKDYNRSCEILEEAFGLDPFHNEIQKRLVLQYIRAGQKEQAVKTDLLVAQLHFEKDSITEAEHFINAALEIEPENLEAHYLRIKMFLKMDKEKDAFQEYAHVAKILTNQKAFEQAMKAYEAALQLIPGNTKIRRQLIDLLLQLDKKSEAANQYRTMADISKHEGSREAALTAYRHAIELEPTDLSLRAATLDLAKQITPVQDLVVEYIQLTELFLQKNDLKKAEQTCLETFQISPKNPNDNIKLLSLLQHFPDSPKLLKPYIYLIEFFIKQNMLDKAVEAGEKARELDSTDTRLLELLSQTYVKSNAVPRALKLTMSVADIYSRKGDTKRAMESYLRVLSFDPHNAEARKLYIETYLQQGLEEEIIEHYLLLGDAYMHNQEFEECLAVLDKVMRIDPTNPDAFHKMQLLNEYQTKAKKIAAVPSQSPSPAKEVQPSRQSERKKDDTTALGGITGYLRTLELNPNNVAVRQKLIRGYIDQKKSKEAVEQLFILSQTYASQGKYEESSKALHDILALDPNNSTAKENLEKTRQFVSSPRNAKASTDKNAASTKNPKAMDS
jgi:tetratricopeptide (TPR) repeat protein